NVGFDLSGMLRTFNPLRCQSRENAQELIADLENVIAGEWAPKRQEPDSALYRYSVSDARRERIRRTFVPPLEYERARALLRTNKVLWITGSPGTGKGFLAAALGCEVATDLNGPVLELRRHVRWEEAFKNRPAGSVLLLPDAVAPERTGSE